MKAYWHSLRNHPGVPVVFLMHAMGFLAGMSRRGGGDNFFYALMSAGAMSIFWIPVLWTAWTARKSALEQRATK